VTNLIFPSRFVADLPTRLTGLLDCCGLEAHRRGSARHMRRVRPIVKRAYELSLDIDADRFEADGPYDPLKQE